MFKNKTPDGRNNFCGKWIRKYRMEMPGGMSQRQFADVLQHEGLDVDKYIVQRIEVGSRFVTDIELKAIAKALEVDLKDLLA